VQPVSLPTSDDELLIMQVSDAFFAAAAQIDERFPDVDRQLLAKVMMHAACNIAGKRENVLGLIQYIHDHFRVGQPTILLDGDD
jgi:hypothetical protein